jgi:hypothetical protein
MAGQGGHRGIIIETKDEGGRMKDDLTLRVIVLSRPFTVVRPEDHLRPKVTRGRDI